MSSEKSTDTKPKGANTGRIISIIVGAVLAGSVGFFAYKWTQAEKQITNYEVNEDNLTTEIEELERDLEDYQVDMENMDLDLEDKERLLQEKELLIEEKQAKIDQLVRENRLSKKQATELSTKIKQLNYYISKYEAQIEELKTQVAMLEEENSELTAELGNMGNRLREVKRSNDEKQFTIETAKVLNAENFSSYYIKSSGKRVMDNPIRKRRMDNISICFQITKNTTASKGQKTVYLQIQDPDGNVIRDGGVQSGYAGLTSSGDQPYTSRASINFDGTTQKVCMDFQKSEDYKYESGSYSVEVYCDGFNIGGGAFEVK